MKQLTKEWFEARKGKITGSRVGAVLGLNPYKNRNELMREMVREYFNEESEFTGNNATRWGEKHEPVAREQYELEQGVYVAETGLVNHPDHNFLAASPDGLVGNEGSIEIKCPYSKKRKRLAENPNYMAQIQLILACSQRSWCDYVVWTPEGMHIERVQADKRFTERNLQALTDFIQEYREIITDAKQAETFLSPLEKVRNDDSWLFLAKQYDKLSIAIKEMQEEQKKLKTALVNEAQGEKTSGGGVLVYPSWRTSFDEKGLSRDYPEIDITAYKKKSKSPTWQVRRQEKNNATPIA